MCAEPVDHPIRRPKYGCEVAQKPTVCKHLIPNPKTRSSSPANVMDLTDRNEIPESDGTPPIVKKIGFGILGLLLIFIAVAVYFHEGPDLKRIEAMKLEMELDATGEDDHETLRYPENLPGTVAPPFVAPREGDDYENQSVIGFLVKDKPYAVLMNPVREKHLLLITAVLEGNGVVATHNYGLKVTRVFTAENVEEPLDVRLGGWEFLRGLALFYDDVRYSQLSEKIPLDDLEFEISSLADWLAQHPETKVCYSEENLEENVVGNWPDNHPEDTGP